MISCDEFFAEFGEYLENRVSPEVREALELHLSQCRPCYVLCDSTRKTLKIVMDSGSFELSPNVAGPIIDRVMTLLRRERARES